MSEEYTPEEVHESLAHETSELIDTILTVELATVDKNGMPDIGYQPYVLTETGMYVYVSKIATNARNMIEGQPTKAMFIEDSETSKILLARQRVLFNLKNVRAIERDGDEFEKVFEQFHAKYGNVYNRLREMTDFQMLHFDFASGSFVRGFAQAFIRSEDGIWGFAGGGIGGKGHEND